jgi:hypothetical protein
MYKVNPPALVCDGFRDETHCEEAIIRILVTAASKHAAAGVAATGAREHRVFAGQTQTSWSRDEVIVETHASVRWQVSQRAVVAGRGCWGGVELFGQWLEGGGHSGAARNPHSPSRAGQHSRRRPLFDRAGPPIPRSPASMAARGSGPCSLLCSAPAGGAEHRSQRVHGCPGRTPPTAPPQRRLDGSPARLTAINHAASQRRDAPLPRRNPDRHLPSGSIFNSSRKRVLTQKRRSQPYCLTTRGGSEAGEVFRVKWPEFIFNDPIAANTINAPASTSLSTTSSFSTTAGS